MAKYINQVTSSEDNDQPEDVKAGPGAALVTNDSYTVSIVYWVYMIINIHWTIELYTVKPANKYCHLATKQWS